MDEKTVENISQKLLDAFGLTIKDLPAFSKKDSDIFGMIIVIGLAKRDSYWLKKIEDLIVEEILICHKENTPTSRLTSLMMKIN